MVSWFGKMGGNMMGSGRMASKTALDSSRMSKEASKRASGSRAKSNAGTMKTESACLRAYLRTTLPSSISSNRLPAAESLNKKTDLKKHAFTFIQIDIKASKYKFN